MTTDEKLIESKFGRFSTTTVKKVEGNLVVMYTRVSGKGQHQIVYRIFHQTCCGRVASHRNKSAIKNPAHHHGTRDFLCDCWFDIAQSQGLNLQINSNPPSNYFPAYFPKTNPFAIFPCPTANRYTISVFQKCTGAAIFQRQRVFPSPRNFE